MVVPTTVRIFHVLFFSFVRIYVVRIFTLISIVDICAYVHLLTRDFSRPLQFDTFSSLMLFSGFFDQAQWWSKRGTVIRTMIFKY